MQIADWGTYLGFAIGPGKGDRSWHKCCAKLVERAWTWREVKAGLHMAARAYNTYGASTMSYVGQLEAFPAMAGAAERRALSLAAQGPGDSWRRDKGFDDLFALKEC